MTKKILFIFAALIVAIVFYRAATLSMTWDEAYTVTVYAAHGENIFSSEKFLPNNHVLHSILVWLMFQLAPWQDWAMRLPACLGALGCLAALWKIGFLLFAPNTEDASAKRFVSVCFLIALVSFHPIVFQFYSFARGYGLSLCFSLFGFYGLLRYRDELRSTAKNSAIILSLSGLAFGLSVAANLSAAIMNTGIIWAAFLFWIRNGQMNRSALLKFCLPGLVVFGVFYGPLLPFVSLKEINYASPTLLESFLDLSIWTWGHSNIVPDDSITRLFLGVPISEELFWTLAVVTPLLFFLPLIVIFAPKSSRDDKSDNPNKTLDTGIEIVAFGLLFYGILLVVLDCFGKPAFPKDRTGIYPVAYFLMLAVMLFHRLNFEVRSPIARRCGKVLAVGLGLCLVQFLSLFAFPYYHNIWYGDAEMKRIMLEIREIKVDEESSGELGTFVCTKLNIASAEYYKMKYDLKALSIVCTRSVDDPVAWARWPGRVFFYLPGAAEEMLRSNAPKIRIRFRTPYLDLIFVEKPQVE